MNTSTIKVQATGIRELTTGRCHSQAVGIMPHAYELIVVQLIVGKEGRMMFHHPYRLAAVSAAIAIQPYIRKHVEDSYFWDGRYDPTCMGRMELPLMTQEEKEEFTELKEKYKHLDEPYGDAQRSLGAPLPFAPYLDSFVVDTPTPELRKQHNIQVSDREWQLARQVGGGNASAGIRHLLSIYELESQ